MNNTARLSGASIYASDMQQCGWLGNDFTNDSTIIFNPPPPLNDSSYPFQYVYVDLPPLLSLALSLSLSLSLHHHYSEVVALLQPVKLLSSLHVQGSYPILDDIDPCVLHIIM